MVGNKSTSINSKTNTGNKFVEKGEGIKPRKNSKTGYYKKDSKGRAPNKNRGKASNLDNRANSGTQKGNRTDNRANSSTQKGNRTDNKANSSTQKDNRTDNKQGAKPKRPYTSRDGGKHREGNYKRGGGYKKSNTKSGYSGGGYRGRSFRGVRAEETVEDIKTDIRRIEKEIKLEIREIRGLKLGV